MVTGSEIITGGNENFQPDPLKKLSSFRYNSPLIQVGLIGFVCFCCPGMYLALTGMGGGGQIDPTVANKANTALYTMFAVFGILGGGIYNILGPQLTLFSGCSTYVLYAGSFLYYNHIHHQAFVIIAGGILGVGAGLLWAVQGTIITSYPPPDRKGTYISIFWCIFTMGGVIGGLIPFILNFHNAAGSVNDSTYIGFMVFMCIGTLISLAILHPSRVVRDDGSTCTNIQYSDLKTECTEILKLFLNWKMLLIFPAAWASNFFYTYQFNTVNGVVFDLRTRGLNNMFYWGAQMVGPILNGYLLDHTFKRRKARGLFGLTIVAVLGTATWGGGLAHQLGYSRDHEPQHKLDFKDGTEFARPFMLYFSYGLLDAMYQSMVYWIIGGLANDSEILSRYVGFYKGVQSAGAAVAWQLDTQKMAYLSQLITNWALLTISYPLLAVVIVLAVKDDNEDGTAAAPNDTQEKTGGVN